MSELSPSLQLAFSNPHVRVIEDTPSLLVVDLPDFPADPRREEILGSRVSVSFDRKLRFVEISRSLYTNNQLYLVHEGSEASLLVTDHFLTALRHCRTNRRTPDDDALVDHFIFGTIPGEKTYSRGITRVGHGRTVRWSAATSRLETVRRQYVERSVTLAFSQALGLLENSLKEVVSSLPRAAPGGTVTNLLSGGVDSTLLQVLLPKGSPSLSVAIDTPEFEPENERALASKKLTGSQHCVVQLCESQYLGAVERFVTTVGLPPHHLQSVLLGEVFRLYEGEKSYLLTGQLADALFGLGPLTRAAVALRRWGWIPRVTHGIRAPVALKPARLRAVESWFLALAHQVSSTRGFAARAACYTNFTFLEKVFDAAHIERRLSDRLQYVLELCPFVLPDSKGPDAQLEAAHLVDYFCDDALSIWRQAAMSYQGYLFGAFTHPTIAQGSLMFRTRDRYWRDGETKPALKALLRKYLPGYDTRMPKLSFELPLKRFLDAGPLRNSHYLTPPPDVFPNLTGREAYPPRIAWHILTLSAWRALAGNDHAGPPLSFSRILT